MLTSMMKMMMMFMYVLMLMMTTYDRDCDGIFEFNVKQLQF